ELVDPVAELLLVVGQLEGELSHGRVPRWGERGSYRSVTRETIPRTRPPNPTFGAVRSGLRDARSYRWGCRPARCPRRPARRGSGRRWRSPWRPGPPGARRPGRRRADRSRPRRRRVPPPWRDRTRGLDPR